MSAAMNKEQATAALAAASAAYRAALDAYDSPYPERENFADEAAYKKALHSRYNKTKLHFAPYREAMRAPELVLKGIEADAKWLRRMTPEIVTRLDQWVERHRDGLTSTGPAHRCDICHTMLGNPASMNRRLGPDCWAMAQRRLASSGNQRAAA